MEEAEYLLPEPLKEVERLTLQDSVFAYSMNNRRILAPLDTTKPNLKILDSGTADGHFLRSIEGLLTPPFTMEGFDVMPAFFPPTHLPHISYAVHSLAEKWPAEMHGQYHFVHQRLALLGAGRTVTPVEAVGFLGALVAPGGWIQLGELDVRKPAKGGQAMHDAMTVIRAVFNSVCSTDDFAYSQADWLKAEGFEDVKEEVYEIDVGARCKDSDMARKSTAAMVQSWEALLGAAKMFNADLDEKVTDRLPERLDTELTRDGGAYNMVYAYGRKPLNP